MAWTIKAEESIEEHQLSLLLNRLKDVFVDSVDGYLQQIDAAGSEKEVDGVLTDLNNYIKASRKEFDSVINNLANRVTGRIAASAEAKRQSLSGTKPPARSEPIEEVK